MEQIQDEEMRNILSELSELLQGVYGSKLSEIFKSIFYYGRQLSGIYGLEEYFAFL